MTERLLSRRRMLDAFGRLGDHLTTAGVVADIHVVGGAVMVTEYGARDATADVGAFDYQPHGAVKRAARLVAEEMDLPPSWLNQHASAFVPRGPTGGEATASTTRACTSTSSSPNSCWR